MIQRSQYKQRGSVVYIDGIYILAFLLALLALLHPTALDSEG